MRERRDNNNIEIICRKRVYI